MFGYVKPFQPELKVKELDAYKAVYCGLCGQLGRSFGVVARMTLSYDFTFLSMLYWAVSAEEPQVKRRRCYINPLKKLPVCTGGGPMEFSADIALIMIYYKLLDNIRDSGIFSSIGWRILKPLAGQAHRKAARARPRCEERIADCLNRRQRQLEAEGVADVDVACEPTATALEGVFEEISSSKADRRILGRTGYLMGRYIYLCDALDDMEDDVRTGGYNPLVLKHGLGAGFGDWDKAREEAVRSLNMTIGEIEKTMALLTLRHFQPIIDNIVTMGLRASVDEILSKKEKHK